MKKYIWAIILCLSTLIINAAPVLPVKRYVRLTDGRELMITAFGDEHLSFFLTNDGEVVLDEDNGFRGTGMTLDEYLATLPELPQRARQLVGSVKTALVKPEGVKKIPVILASFADKSFSVALSDKKVNSYYDRFFNGSRDGSHYTGTDNLGSVRDYFVDQSLDQFQPDFTIIGPVKLDSVYAYYGQDSGSSKDIYYSTFVKEAFTKAKAQYQDWSSFDNDGDGKVDLCVVIFAGLGQNYTNAYKDKNTIWPKEMPSSYTIDGVTLSGCCSACESRPYKVSDGYITEIQPEGVGLVIHEISHALGLPDFYDTKYVAFGMDFWSVMDYGEYCNASRIPVGYTAYEREFLGWQQTETISGPCTLRLKSFAEGGKGYKLINEANPDECYILDNRQAKGWDQGLCANRGHGMLVLHVDYIASRWTSNTVNTAQNRQLMSIIPANDMLRGSNTLGITQALWKESLQGHPYPGITENTELSNTSVPPSTVFTGSYMNKPIYDIEELEDGTITAKVMPLGTLDTPTDLAYYDVEGKKLMATWAPVKNAEKYNLRLYRDGELVMRQDSIADTTYELQNLESNSDYTFDVQAISDKYRNSVWAGSESIRIDPDLITEITTSALLVRIYDLNGRFAGECFADELHRLSLRAGIYVIRSKESGSRKVLIR